EVVERSPDGLGYWNAEHTRRLWAGLGLARNGPRDRDRLKIAVEQNLHFVAEDRDPIQLLAQGHDDPAVPDVVNVAQRRGAHVVFVQSVSRGNASQEIPGGLLGGRSNSRRFPR